MDNMECSSMTTSPREFRKRIRDPTSWKREREKVARYSAKCLPQYPGCNHKGKPYQSFQCSCLTMYDIQQFHKNFYEIKRKDIQDSFILKHCEGQDPKRHKYEPLTKPKSVSIKYFVYSLSSNRKVPVCRKAFIDILGITKHRVLSVTKHYKKLGHIPKDKRGGDKVSHLKASHRLKVQQFIESLKCNEPEIL